MPNPLLVRRKLANVELSIKTVLDVSKTYELLGSTICLFFKYFDEYLLSLTTEKIIEDDNKLSVSAVVCLRLAIKFNES